MTTPRHISNAWRNGGQWTAVSALLVLLAVVTLPACPRVGAAYAVGQDVRTITEDRSVVEHFTAPGHYLLHGFNGLQEPCEICDDADSATDQHAATSTVLTIDVTYRETTLPFSAAPSMLAARPLLASDRVPADHIAPVPAPPPRLG